MDSNPLPAVIESTDTRPLPARSTDFKTETIEQESTPLQSRKQRFQHISPFSTLDQLRYALEYPLSPDDTIKHHQADEEEETKKNKSSN